MIGFGQKRPEQQACAKRRCRRQPTQAFDVGSWFRTPREQELVHYEVCDKHADYFTGSFERTQSERVRADLEPWPA